MLPAEWQKNNAFALQALICGRQPEDEAISIKPTETCTALKAAEICRIGINAFRQYVNDHLPQTFRKLGLPSAPQPLNSAARSTQQLFDLNAVKKWAEKLDEVRAKAEEEKRKKAPTRAELMAKGEFVTVKDLAKAAGVTRKLMNQWTREGLPEHLRFYDDPPAPSYVFPNCKLYRIEALEWAKGLKAAIKALSAEKRKILNLTKLRTERASTRRMYPDLVSRGEVALMIGVAKQRLNVWCASGIPKTLRACGLPEFPKAVDVIAPCKMHNADEVSAWILEYRHAEKLMVQEAEELAKARAERRTARLRNRVPRASTVQMPDVSDLGFEVVCMADASLILGFDSHRVSKIYCLGVSQKMKRAGIPEFPPVVCRRKGYSFFKKSDIEEWGRAFRNVYPDGIVRKTKNRGLQDGSCVQ